MFPFFKKRTSYCPLCGEKVSWSEEKAAEYACLYVCVRVIPYPAHLLNKHRDYLSRAKKIARPIFFTAILLTFSTFFSYLILGVHYLTLVILFLTILMWVYGWVVRRRLIREYSTTHSA